MVYICSNNKNNPHLIINKKYNIIYISKIIFYYKCKLYRNTHLSID